jgi:hypothetical protein
MSYVSALEVSFLILMSLYRISRKPEDPRTPDKFRQMSKRTWDIQVRRWRRQLHQYDPKEEHELAMQESEHGRLIEEEDLLDE